MEFTKEELIKITDALHNDGQDELAMIVATEIDRMTDLENMDFDDCAGGGCKL